MAYGGSFRELSIMFWMTEEIFGTFATYKLLLVY